jgi:RNA polymerase sigma-70 factor (ECF subfamily)
MEKTELRARIQSALAGLNEPYRSVVILREIQDLKYEEIAQAVDLPLNTVKSYIHRGRKMLREELREIVSHDAV